MLIRDVEHLLVLRNFKLAPTRRFALTRTALLFGHSHADFGCQGPHGLGKRGPGVLHQKRDGTAVCSTAKAMVELFGRADRKGRGFLVRSEEHTSELQS